MAAKPQNDNHYVEKGECANVANMKRKTANGERESSRMFVVCIVLHFCLRLCVCVNETSVVVAVLLLLMVDARWYFGWISIECVACTENNEI